MRIVTRQQFSGHWTAVDDATYDGTGCPIGAGPTEAAAIADLIDQIEELARERTDDAPRSGVLSDLKRGARSE